MMYEFEITSCLVRYIPFESSGFFSDALTRGPEDGQKLSLIGRTTTYP
jgi:hypothetical protein